MGTFQIALKKVLIVEGHYSDDRRDPGNWTSGIVGKGLLKGTKYGISAASYPHLDIKNLVMMDAEEIYRRDYWDKLQLDKIENISSGRLADMLFNLSVNCGPGNAGKFLQRSINALIIQEGLDMQPTRESKWQQAVLRVVSNKALKVDGAIGPITMSALKLIPHPLAISAAVFGEAYNHYAAGNINYRAGWFNRLGFSYLS